ncbi:MAG: sterol desaturase family protein, partial [Gemmatimonadota bacterium]
MSIILYSIPFFFVFMAGELAVQAWTGRRLFRLNDSIADLSCGILSQLSGIATKFLTVGIYVLALRHASLQGWLGGLPRWPSGAPVAAGDAFPGFVLRIPEAVSWVVVFLLVDLAYYWSHRLSHEINVLWAGHVVHHSSEEYNLAVALRQSSLHGLFTWIFYIPLALLGIPWEMFVASYSINLVYQFWIHTRAVGRMGRWTEWILNTPSHHRVHHGVNPKYQDRNYAGVFILWDRLFGTFQPEEEEPVYGITMPLRSWNPLWANVHVFWDIWLKVLRARSWRERWMYVFGPPGWRPEEEGGRIRPPEVSRETAEPWDPQVPGTLAWYGFLHFGVALAAAVVLLFNAGTLPTAHLLAGGFYVTLTLAGVGGVFETARWAGPMETWRNVVLGACPSHAVGRAQGVLRVLMVGTTTRRSRSYGKEE